ncbi:MAG: tRNA (guanosine(46)-N7)-methyltransferase TrmB [Planctomycetota bacterium]|jgi:tRNA (guanine-N7-)-methyltransferase
MRRILKDYPEISLKCEDLDGEIDFAQIFGRTGPVHIEVGVGKGTFLINQAKAQPEVNFLGIEWARKYYRFAVDRAGRWALRNVRIIRTGAAGFLADFVPDDSVDCLHIYFPDPWPKKRHHKRRFVSPANAEQFLRCLKTSGCIRIATDHADYFEQIREVLAEKSDRLEETEFLPTVGADQGEWVGTNFERKYLKEKRPIYTIAVTKIR